MQDSKFSQILFQILLAGGAVHTAPAADSDTAEALAALGALAFSCAFFNLFMVKIVDDNRRCVELSRHTVIVDHIVQPGFGGVGL